MANKRVTNFEVGKVYYQQDSYGGDKYFLKRNDDILMVNTENNLINVHDTDLLERKVEYFDEVLVEASLEDFERVIRTVIETLGITQYMAPQ